MLVGGFDGAGSIGDLLPEDGGVSCFLVSPGGGLRTLVASLRIEVTIEQGRAILVELLSETRSGASRRAVLDEVWRTQGIELNPQDTHKFAAEESR